MAEIKSTLDLIMEKTKNLELSAAEKTEIRRREISGTVRGWLQKFMDGLLSLDALQKAYKAEYRKFPLVRDIMKEALFERISLHEDNNGEITLIGRLLDIPTAPVQQLIQSFRDELMRREKDGRQKAHTLLLARGISGGAVVPSAAMDPGWSQSVSGIEAAFLEVRRDLATSL